jgi:NAD(P)-dependent dehydrogenase (short-subunit alcohol dehydrogenase family)
MAEFDNKVVLVTGGLSGIGRGIVELFADRGARLVIFDRAEQSRDDELSGEELAEGLTSEAAYVRGDVSKPEDVDLLFDTALERFGRVDVLVNNAGVTAFKPIDHLTADDFDHVMAVNVRGTFLTCKRAIVEMRKQRERGVIVNVASNFGFVGAPEASVYCASKGAVVTMTKALALETGSDGIRINALCPGATATEFNRQHRARQEVVESWARKTPLRIPGREEFLASPAQIAEGALFLATEGSGYMTGASLVMDGGWNAE